MIRFTSQLFRPRVEGKPVTWTFLKLPATASKRLPSRGMVSIEGDFAGMSFQATLEPDGEGGHWLKVPKQLRIRAGVEPGDVVTLAVEPVTREPEPRVPPDLRRALGAAPEANAVWDDITPGARRDWIHWITSAKKSETRDRRILTACSMLAAGKRRPCCFDRSGMYSKSLTCPVAVESPHDGRTTRQ